jgi:hypothetical protein
MLQALKKNVLFGFIVCTSSMTSSAAIDIQFDYSLDTQGFFSSSDAKTSLEAAGSFFEGLLQDTFDAITPGTVYNAGTEAQFSDTWTIDFNHPGTGNAHSIVDKSIAANTLLIYAGGRNVDGSGGTLASAGPWGYSVSGVTSFLDNVLSRGESGITDGSGSRLSTETDFAPGGGSIVFDTSESWFYNSDVNSTTAPTGGQMDFLSTAMHELAHVLGFGTADGGSSNDGSWSGKISSGAFTGAFSKASNGGSNVSLDGGNGHWADGTTSVRHLDGVSQEANMDPTTTSNERKLFTNLDIMGLRDVGWEINVSAVPEPSFYATVFGLALLGFGLVRRRKLQA